MPTPTEVQDLPGVKQRCMNRQDLSTSWYHPPAHSKPPNRSNIGYLLASSRHPRCSKPRLPQARGGQCPLRTVGMLTATGGRRGWADACQRYFWNHTGPGKAGYEKPSRTPARWLSSVLSGAEVSPTNWPHAHRLTSYLMEVEQGAASRP